MRECMYCDGPLDVNENGLAYSIALTVYDPAYAAHDVCAEAAQGMQRNLALHRLYCHLPNCFWESKQWRGWRRNDIAPEPTPPNVGDRIRIDMPTLRREP